MKHGSLCFLLAMLALMRPAATARADDPPAADLAVINGKVWTVDPAHPRAEAVAIAGERIVAVGTNAEVRRWIGSKTRTVDAGGNTVLPGFIDAQIGRASCRERV